MHRGISIFICFLLFASAAGCVTEKAVTEKTPVSFAVEIVSTPSHCEASEEDPCPFSMDSVTFRADIIAINKQRAIDTTYNETVLLSLIPGGILPRDADNVYNLPDGRKAVAVPMTNGRATDVSITFKAGFGAMQMFVEDMGYSPIRITNECMINGIGCPACYGNETLPKGCFQADDNNPLPGQGGGGVSGNIYFENPTLAQVQFVEDVPGAIETSPLEGFRVTVDGLSPNGLDDFSDCIDTEGNIKELLVITSVTNDGFYVTDVCNNGGPVHAPDTWRDFGSIFAFNFHAPEDLMTGDCITWFQGSIDEFYGFTEMKNPAWSSPVCMEDISGCEPSCLGYLPEPRSLDSATLNNDYSMEMLEASLVAVENATIGYSTSCDFNGNGQIDFDDSEENNCKRNCEATYDCWVLEDYKNYFQFTVHVGTGKIAVILQGVVAFDPLQHEGETVSYIAGIVKHLSFARPPWQLYPRNEDDFVF